MNQDIQTIRQLIDATLELFAQDHSGNLNPESDQVKKWIQVCTDTVADMGRSDEMRRIRDALHLSNEALAVVCLIALPETDSAYRNVFERFSPSRNRVPDLDLLTSIVCTDYPSKSKLLHSLDSRSPLFLWKYLVAKGKGPLANRSLSIDPILTACLNGTLNEAPGNLLSYWPGSPLQLKADADLKTNNTPLQIISGGGSPERQLTVAINLSNNFFKIPLYRLNAALLRAQKGTDGLRQAFVYATLKKASVYWQDGLRDINAYPEYGSFAGSWLKMPGSVLFAGETESSDFPETLDPLAVTNIPLSPLSNSDKTLVWSQMGYAFLGKNAIDWEQCALRYNCNVARIGKTLMRQRQGQQTGAAYSVESVMDSYLNTSPQGIGDGIGELVSSGGALADMVMNYSTQKEFHSLCDAFVNRSKLKNLPSPGMICILQGPPGIGKTMAAHALASELRIPLYRINYSKAASASASQFSTLFSEGNQTSAALLFDDADLLFASKSESNNPGDLISAFLIQKAESYPGLIILTTNVPDKIDPAIRRRARTISFSHLTPAQRISLMQTTAAQNDAVFDKHVDVTHIANSFELTPLHVKRMICNAVVSARANSTPSKTIITAEDFAAALKLERK